MTTWLQLIKVVVTKFAAKASSAKLVLVGAGPPYHNGMEAGIMDSRSPLHVLVQPIVSMLRSSFNWCPVHFFHEFLFHDGCFRPRSSPHVPVKFSPTEHALVGFLYAVEKDFTGLIGVSVPKKVWFFIHRFSSHPSCYGTICFECPADPLQFLEKGWKLHPDSTHLPAFTVPQPSTSANPTAAGIHRCGQAEKERWRKDRFRFSTFPIFGPPPFVA